MTAPSLILVGYGSRDPRVAQVSHDIRAGVLAIRPELDGVAVMDHLGIGPGPLVGQALAHLLEIRLDEGDGLIHGPADPLRERDERIHDQPLQVGPAAKESQLKRAAGTDVVTQPEDRSVVRCDAEAPPGATEDGGVGGDRVALRDVPIG